MIDEFIMSDEFKAEERAKLQALPAGSVELLTHRLNGLEMNGVGELRVFECLSIKLGQFGAVLPPKIQADAIAALKAKMMDEGHQHHAHRVRLFDASMRGTVALPDQSPPGTNSTSIVPSPRPEKAVDTEAVVRASSEGPAAPMSWSMMGGLIVVGGGALWWLLRRRK